MCVPGCSEEFMLHVYSNFRSSNLAVIIVCTDNNPQCFDQCQQFSNAVFDFLSLPQNKYFAGANKAPLLEVVDRSVLEMYEVH